ncbi:MAG: histone deacetylase [Armatimonadota bacterium]
MAVGRVYDSVFLEHGVEWHIEKARRLEAIHDQLQGDGLWNEMVSLEVPAAATETIALVHTEPYIDEIRRISRQGGGELDHDTIATAQTWDAATRAVGGCVAAVDAIFAGEVQSAAALVRPPGHHALPNRGMGFCFFNNAAIAAEYAIRSQYASRVAIVDFDVHHGNGTQDFFYNRGDVLYVSTHQDPFYPGTGLAAEMGVDEGLHKTVNCPLPSECDDRLMLRVYDEVIVPVLTQFDPEFLIMSAGYDGYHKDPLAGHAITTGGYHTLSRRLARVAHDTCGGRVLMVLEGGYNLDVLGLCVENTILALMNREPMHEDPNPRSDTATQAPALVEHVKDLIDFHRQWHEL